MGWKWNDIADLMRELGIFTEEQITAVDKIVTQKKHELVDVLEGLAADAEPHNKERAKAFREVIAGVKPHHE